MLQEANYSHWDHNCVEEINMFIMGNYKNFRQCFKIMSELVIYASLIHHMFHFHYLYHVFTFLIVIPVACRSSIAD